MGKATNLMNKMKLFENLDDPIPFKVNIFGKKILIMIIYEDQTYEFYKRKLKKNYMFTIKSKDYFIVPKCFLKGSPTMILYYYNNPIPLQLQYNYTKLSASSLKSKAELDKLVKAEKERLANIKIDSEALQSAFSSNLINKMYSENNFFTLKNILIIVFSLLFITLVILQVTGTVDVMGMLTGYEAK